MNDHYLGLPSKSNFRTAIVGGGAAGTMAALRGVLNNQFVTLYTGNAKDKKRSREKWVSKVENMPGFLQYKKGIVDPNRETIEWIEQSKFAENLEVCKAGVTGIDYLGPGKGFELSDDQGNKKHFYAVVLATGIMDVQPHIQGSIRPVLSYANNQLIDYCIRCDGHHVHQKNALVIGHSKSAAWVAIMLRERYDVKSMGILTNGEKPEFSEDPELQNLLKLYGITVYEKPIESIKGAAKELILEGFLIYLFPL